MVEDFYRQHSNGTQELKKVKRWEHVMRKKKYLLFQKLKNKKKYKQSFSSNKYLLSEIPTKIEIPTKKGERKLLPFSTEIMNITQLHEWKYGYQDLKVLDRYPS